MDAFETLALIYDVPLATKEELPKLSRDNTGRSMVTTYDEVFEAVNSTNRSRAFLEDLKRLDRAKYRWFKRTMIDSPRSPFYGFGVIGPAYKYGYVFITDYRYSDLKYLRQTRRIS